MAVRTRVRAFAVATCLTLGVAACSSSAPTATSTTPASTTVPTSGPQSAGSHAPGSPSSASSAGSTGQSGSPATSSPSSSPTPTDPLAGVALAVVPGAAAEAQQKYQASGDTTDARLIGRLAAQPTASWFGGGTPSTVQQEVQTVVHQAAGRSPVLVAYDIPDRDCGGYSGGGQPGPMHYAAWIAGFARGLGDAPAIVVLEPDAIPQTLPQGGCQAFDSSSADSDRYAMLAGAVKTLASDPQAHVYLDAGNAGWITDKSALADALRSSGIGDAAGFTLNVSSFYTTADSIAYGDELSDDLGGAHFIVDTSRNGAGPYYPPAGDTTPAQCNPPGRELGSDPTTSTGHALVDAYLWIKIPGESDGTCRGGPTAGQWWPSYALALVRDSNASS